jgi:hypothetical protein
MLLLREPRRGRLSRTPWVAVLVVFAALAFILGGLAPLAALSVIVGGGSAPRRT